MAEKPNLQTIQDTLMEMQEKMDKNQEKTDRNQEDLKADIRAMSDKIENIQSTIKKNEERIQVVERRTEKLEKIEMDRAAYFMRMQNVVEEKEEDLGGTRAEISTEGLQRDKNEEGSTAFDLAVEQGNDGCAGLLQDGGWDGGFEDSGASSSEETLVDNWQAAPLSPGHLTDQALVRRLRKLGAEPRPVLLLTWRLYVRLLERLSREAETPARKGSAAYSPELASALDAYRIPPSKADEMALAAEFDQPDKSRRWREGLLKSSFNYLLLDPRVTQNLPARCQLLSLAEAFRTFVRAIFYVGKGSRGRPYRHLSEALTHYRKGQATQVSSKVRHILEIWAGGQGVVSMHCFQNVIPVEAYTREACMVDAIGLEVLTNQKKGNYYGTVAGWPMKRQRNLGVFLLHRAFRSFLAEGERQLRPADI